LDGQNGSILERRRSVEFGRFFARSDVRGDLVGGGYADKSNLA